jgi:hypothetical protein
MVLYPADPIDSTPSARHCQGRPIVEGRVFREKDDLTGVGRLTSQLPVQRRDDGVALAADETSRRRSDPACRESERRSAPPSENQHRSGTHGRPPRHLVKARRHVR